MTWSAYLATVHVGGALPIEFRMCDLSTSGAERCRVAMVVPDVDCDREIEISTVHELPEWDEQTAAEWVRERVLWMYRHEAEEQITVAGQRVFYPGHEHGEAR